MTLFTLALALHIPVDVVRCEDQCVTHLKILWMIQKHAAFFKMYTLCKATQINPNTIQKNNPATPPQD